MGNELKSGLGSRSLERQFRTGATGRVRDAKKIAEDQQRKEELRLAEATSAVATSEASALSGKAGRKSLLKTSPTGLALNLGGTNA